MSTSRTLLRSAHCAAKAVAHPASITIRAHSCFLSPASRTTSSHTSLIAIPSVAIRSYGSAPWSGRHPKSADEIANHLQDMYAEAVDEFEIAVDSTESAMTYSASDREAARDELTKLQRAWAEALNTPVAHELRRRPIGERIRELENAVVELERRGLEIQGGGNPGPVGEKKKFVKSNVVNN